MFRSVTGDWLGLAVSVLSVAFFVSLMVTHARLSSASARARRLLDGHWAEASARVLHRRLGRRVIELNGSVVLRVPLMRKAQFAVVARAGRVWVLGPDERGWAVVRVPGSHEPWVARVSTRAGGETETIDTGVDHRPWHRVQASVDPWVARSATTWAVARLRVDDGQLFTATMARAPVDLLGTVWDTGSLWVVGPVERGTTVTVGFPGFPMQTTAEIT